MGRLTDYELHEAVIILRQRARHHPGQQQALWDLILDIEASLQGRWSVLSREQIEREVERELQV